MSRANEERYVFETEWFDIQASLIRKYLFTFYPADNTIEMVSHYQNKKVNKKILLIKKAKICRDQSK
jgi:hypothetical protein